MRRTSKGRRQTFARATAVKINVLTCKLDPSAWLPETAKNGSRLFYGRTRRSYTSIPTRALTSFDCRPASRRRRRQPVVMLVPFEVGPGKQAGHVSVAAGSVHNTGSRCSGTRPPKPKGAAAKLAWRVCVYVTYSPRAVIYARNIIRNTRVQNVSDWRRQTTNPTG